MPSIILKTSNQTLYYSTVEAEIKNPIGKVSATLIEYVITDKEEAADVFCKLYKTKEGFWYDPANPDDRVDAKTKHNIKAAIDAVENKNTKPKPFHI
jgi:ABC-type molybdenum transport system ATPase subunit/photorepair protein PhrA